MDCNTYGFTVELYDKQADMMREYMLTAFEPIRGPLEVAMYDPKNQRSFLKRMEIPGLSLQDLYVGNTVTVYARQLKVTRYNDANSKARLEKLHDCVSVVTDPSLYPNLGSMLVLLERAGLRLVRMRLVNDHGPVVALQVAGNEAANRWESVSNALPAGSVEKVSTEDIAAYFDRKRFPTTAAFHNCSLCLIRPHILKEGGYGSMIQAIQEAGLEINALEILHMQRAEVVELFDVYKGVLPYYLKLVENMSSGPLIALELRSEGTGESPVLKFRELCGPHDVDIARHLRPNCLRALFGKDSAQNGVHCTDLEEDGDLEVQYVFNSLLGK